MLSPLSTIEKLTLALVFVNAIYVVVALFQWRAIKYQVRMSHRAQLAASPAGDPVNDLFRPYEPHVHIAVTNVGQTAAYDVKYESWAEVLSFPFVGFSTQADYFKSQESSALYPHHQALTINIPFRNEFSARDKADILNNSRFVCLRVRVSYKDVFSWRRRYANFGFYMQGSGLAFLPKYNDAN